MNTITVRQYQLSVKAKEINFTLPVGRIVDQTQEKFNRVYKGSVLSQFVSLWTAPIE